MESDASVRNKKPMMIIALSAILLTGSAYLVSLQMWGSGAEAR
jgi:hypothetical protein